MPDPVSLGAATVRWGLLVGRDRRAAGVRLEIGRGAAERAVPLSSLLQSVVRELQQEPAGAFPRGLVLLAPGPLEIDEGLASWSAPRNVLLEVPASGLGDESRMRILFEARRAGLRQALNVQDGMPAPERLPFFQYLVGAGTTALSHTLAWMSLDVAAEPEAEHCFRSGAAYVIPGPVHGFQAPPGTGFSPSQRAIFELVRLIRSDADLHSIEKVFEGEPLLAYMLLTLANSAAFRVGAPTASLRQAVMKLGYQRLVKWLVLILAVSNKDAKVAPLVYRALVRAYCMEHLAREARLDVDLRDESFIVGAFTLLDAITGQSLDSLLSEVDFPDSVKDALLRGQGPHAPALALTRSLERGEPGVAASSLPLGAEAINGALLRAIAAADTMTALG